METTPTNSPTNDLKFSGALYQDSLKQIWKSDEQRPDIYSGLQFTYFWECRDTVDRPK
jgi:hypothetical protein